MGEEERFCKKIKKELGLFFNWPLVNGLELGHYGNFKNYNFEIKESICRALNFQPLIYSGKKGKQKEFKKGININCRQLVEGDVINNEFYGKLNFKFSRKNLHYLLIQNYRIKRFSSFQEVANKIIEEYQNNTFKIEGNTTYIVTEIWESKLTKRISASDGNGELTIEGKVPVELGYFGFINGKAKTCNTVDKFISINDLQDTRNIPLFKLYKLVIKKHKKPKFSKFDNSTWEQLDLLEKPLNIISYKAKKTSKHTALLIKSATNPDYKVPIIKGVSLSSKRNNIGVRVVNPKIVSKKIKVFEVVEQLNNSDRIPIDKEFKFKSL